MSKTAADELLSIMEGTGRLHLTQPCLIRGLYCIDSQRKVEALLSMKQSIKKESIEVGSWIQS